MAMNIVDKLNTILTSTLEYEEVLKKKSDFNIEKSSISIVKESIKLAENDTKMLMNLISKLGGDIESSERHTDQSMLRWFSDSFLDSSNHEEIVTHIIEAEENKLSAYEETYDTDELTASLENEIDEQLRRIRSHIQKCEQQLEPK